MVPNDGQSSLRYLFVVDLADESLWVTWVQLHFKNGIGALDLDVVGDLLQFVQNYSIPVEESVPGSIIKNDSSRKLVLFLLKAFLAHPHNGQLLEGHHVLWQVVELTGQDRHPSIMQ